MDDGQPGETTEERRARKRRETSRRSSQRHRDKKKSEETPEKAKVRRAYEKERKKIQRAKRDAKETREQRDERIATETKKRSSSRLYARTNKELDRDLARLIRDSGAEPSATGAPGTAVAGPSGAVSPPPPPPAWQTAMSRQFSEMSIAAPAAPAPPHVAQNPVYINPADLTLRPSTTYGGSVTGTPGQYQYPYHQPSAYSTAQGAAYAGSSSPPQATYSGDFRAESPVDAGHPAYAPPSTSAQHEYDSSSDDDITHTGNRGRGQVAYSDWSRVARSGPPRRSSSR
ncbi:hypothetical protein OG946_12115 [Streptomyces sp. NBC_01808]|uniref:hypothetical protein n=1 Tax=Streptomyces sp. NBC_01808 TaxID=2975947 RepID=UPI002DDBB172|nr:hypothetical protein [Streptomyces sp. NBC_01808]WSA38057.1 hypothetical protein OG946_12115 [Streptomyces sp. NBC_01808]